MPQIATEQYPALKQYCSERGVGVAEKIIHPDLLKARQRIRHNYAANRPADKLRKPVLASADHFVLDGNHRWAAHVIEQRPLHVWQLDLPFEQAIPFLFEFGATTDERNN